MCMGGWVWVGGWVCGVCVPVCVCVCVFVHVCGGVRVRVCVSVWVGGLTLNLEIALNNWINSLNTTSSLGIRVAPATRTRGEGGQRPPSPLVIIIKVGRFLVRSSLTHAATDCGRLFTIVNCRIWKETVRLKTEMAKFRK